ncbi:ferredoxin [Nocardioides sp. CN2-186]|uniref:ferredoxin n=1 Tax=Nocardioides tweenelious TaxID=3156607 RepID=UPI0032B37208
MKIEVDWAACISSGMCTAAAPDLFALDEKSQLLVLVEGELEGSLPGQAVEAVDVCPVQAIRLVGER